MKCVLTCVGFTFINLLFQGVICRLLAQSCPTGVRIVSIQQKLKPDEILLEYFITDSSLNIHAITANDNSYSQQKLVPVFWSTVTNFKRSLRIADPGGFSSPGHALYAFLIYPVKNLLRGKKRMIIVPGKDLFGLPFEAFIRCKDSSRPFSEQNIQYLVQDFEIIYHFSIRQWAENFIVISEPDIEFLGFSPVFEHHPGLNPLPYSKKEIKTIGALFKKKGRSYRLIYDQYSGKECFKEVSGRGKIVHLATHYLPQSMGHVCGGFLFWGYDPATKSELCPQEILTQDEISHLKLNADLVVLNACSSGIILPPLGTTLQSLSLSFFLAGARNTLCALWNVTDALANQFMIDFYRRCLSGKTYSQALREVKINLISKQETSLPTIWAPYVLTGQ